MDTCASPSDTMFRFAMPPADAWLEACTPGTWLLHMFVIAAPTAYSAPEAPAVGKLILIVCPAAGFAAPEAAFLSSPHPARAPVRVRAASDSAIAFFHFFVMMIPLSFFYPTLLHRES